MASKQHHAGEAHHVIPMKVYMAVAVSLFILTFLTVGAHNVLQPGNFKTIVAFAIATVKAILVIGYFMHLKYDNMINRVVFGTAFMGLVLLFFFCALDIGTRIPAEPLVPMPSQIPPITAPANPGTPASSTH
ncbi:MAG: cytochrome C oxidase subunit IV family protein [Pseudobdellovibrionaceae bacterium]